MQPGVCSRLQVQVGCVMREHIRWTTEFIFCRENKPGNLMEKKRAERNWKFPLKWKKKPEQYIKNVQSWEKSAVSARTWATKESNRNSMRTARRWTVNKLSVDSRESVHCEAHSTRSERPVNQSSQLPSTTSRHRARLAQDRKHVTKRLTQPSASSLPPVGGWGLRHDHTRTEFSG